MGKDEIESIVVGRDLEFGSYIVAVESEKHE